MRGNQPIRRRIYSYNCIFIDGIGIIQMTLCVRISWQNVLLFTTLNCGRCTHHIVNAQQQYLLSIICMFISSALYACSKINSFRQITNISLLVCLFAVAYRAPFFQNLPSLAERTAYANSLCSVCVSSSRQLPHRQR